LVAVGKGLRDCEAAFAQSQLLDFIRSDRYTSTPLAFANIMAGLPIVHWRQSMTCCLCFQDGAREGITYYRFLTVAEVMKRSPANGQKAVERMKTRLAEAKGQDEKILKELKDRTGTSCA
jgi:hypothetical protein